MSEMSGGCKRCGHGKSCTYTITDNIQITIGEDNMSVLASYKGADEFNNVYNGDGRGIGIAIDLGTTTIAIEQIDMSDGSVTDRCGFMNPQIEYGSDVISRIRTGSTEDGLTKLRSSVVTRISSELAGMGYAPADISRIIISGNTTMNAILERLLLDNLGHAPFEIRNPDSITVSGRIF